MCSQNRCIENSNEEDIQELPATRTTKEPEARKKRPSNPCQRPHCPPIDLLGDVVDVGGDGDGGDGGDGK